MPDAKDWAFLRNCKRDLWLLPIFADYLDDKGWPYPGLSVAMRRQRPLGEGAFRLFRLMRLRMFQDLWKHFVRMSNVAESGALWDGKPCQQ